MNGFYNNDIFARENSQTRNENKRKKGYVHRLWYWLPKYDYTSLQLMREWSIHGVKFIAQVDRHVIERLLWTVTVLSSVGAAVYLSYGVVQKYTNSPVIVSFQSSHTTVSEVPFPAVTICNVNRFRKSAFEKALKNATDQIKNPSASIEAKESASKTWMFLKQINHICDSAKSFSTTFKYSLNKKTVNLEHRGLNSMDSDAAQLTGENVHAHDALKLLQSSWQMCDEMILLCLWEGEEVNCSKIFAPVTTDFGVCCTFNRIPGRVLLKINDTKYMGAAERFLPQEMLDAWKKFNLDESILSRGSKASNDYPKRQLTAGKSSGLSVLLYPEIEEYFCTGTDGAGFKVLPHSPIEFPHVTDLGFGLGLNDEAFMNVQADVTKADKDIEDLTSDERHCYFLHEYTLENYMQYTSANCIEECILNLTLKYCDCVMYDMPQTENNNAFCGDHKSMECALGVKRNISREGTKKDCKHCLPSCNRIQYLAQLSSLTARDDVNIWLKDGQSAKWAGKNVSILHVYFGSDTVNSRVRKRLYGYTELCAQVGGILGLCLGFSVISLVEPIYFCFRLLIGSGQVTNSNQDDINTNKGNRTTQVEKYTGNYHHNKENKSQFPFLN